MKSIFLIIILSVLAISKGPNVEDINKAVKEFEKDLGTELRNTQHLKFVKRWQNRWLKRIDEDGSFDMIELYNTYQRELSKKSSNLQTSDIEWTVKGPFGLPQNGKGVGRINVVRVDPTNENILYVATASGGVWRSTNQGDDWSILPSTQFLSLAFSDIAIAPSNPNVIYLASGDANGTYATAGDYYSLGVMKSVDGGNSFQLTNLTYELTDQQTIGRVLVDPNDENYVIASARNGIWVTTDGGENWERTYEAAIVKDMELKPNDPNVVLATTFNREGGANILKSTDKGMTWENKKGFGTGARVDLAIQENFPDYVVAVSCATAPFSFNEFAISEDFGDTWVTASDNTNAPNILGRSANGGYIDPNSDDRDQGLYDLSVAIAPNNKNAIYVGGINNWYSNNGGSSWTFLSDLRVDGQFMHVDQHDLIILNDGTRFYTNDGGIYRMKGGELENISTDMNIGQIYRASYSSDFAWNLIGLQDNSTQHYKEGEGWYQTNGLSGDGMDNAINPINNQIWYGSSQYGSFRRSLNAGNSWSFMFSENRAPEEEGDWVTPIKLDPNNPANVFLGYYNIWRSTQAGAANSFQRISDFNNENSLTMIDIAESNSSYIYTSNGSTIWRSTNGGIGWSTLPIAVNGISSLHIHPEDPEKIVITAANYTNGRKVYVYDGEKWSNISGNLPNVPANVAKFQANSPDRIYVGTEIGVYYTDYNSAYWERYGSGMPFTIILDLELNEEVGKIGAASYGTGMYEADLIDCNVPTLRISDVESLEFCEGDGIELSVENPQPGVNYTWSNGEVGSSIFVTKEGQYSFITDAECPQKSNFVEISELPVGNISIFVSSREICPGDTITLRAPFGSDDPVWDDGSTGSIRQIYSSGTYTLEVSNNFGCRESGFVVISEPVAPEIRQSEEDILSVGTEYEQYQWYFNGEMIDDANSNTFQPAEEGLYSVELTIQEGCIIITDELDFQFTSVNQKTNLSISPNPNNGIFNLDLSSINEKINSIEIVNSLGQTVKTLNYSFGSDLSINLSESQAGVYFVVINTSQNSYIDKFIIE